MNKDLEKFIAKKGCSSTYWIAFSGGVDSYVLLHSIVELRKNFPLIVKAIHINHNIHADSANWVKHCEEICKNLQVEFISEDIHLESQNNLEEQARNARYEIFAKVLSTDDVLLTGHHKDDQAETVLLQLFRGAGPKGLSAMPVEKKFAKGILYRPFLNVTREEIKTYALHQNLNWIEDSSNSDSSLTRNFLRSDVIPLLQSRWPSLSETLTRVAINCQETQGIIEEFATNDLATVKTSQANILSLKKLAMFSPQRQRQILRTWLHELNFLLPNQKKLLQLQQDFLNAADDRFPHMTWGNVEIYRFNDELHAVECLTAIDPTQIIPWDLSKPLSLANLQLTATLVQGKGLKQNLENITVRFRQGGEKCKLPGKDITQSVKKIFQEKNIPTWERNRIPLIYVGDNLAAAVNYFVTADFAANSHEMGWEIYTQS